MEPTGPSVFLTSPIQTHAVYAAMVELYRPDDDAFADEVEAALQDMLIAHEVHTVGSAAELPFDTGAALPVLRENGDVLADGDAIRTRLSTLRSVMQDWDRFQSDACYIEDDGTIC